MWPFSTPFPTFKPSEVGAAVPYTEEGIEQYTYDYIVVGGGTAGCVLASRLSEIPGVSVLVIERGRHADKWADRVPLISANFFRKDSPSAMWDSAPMEHVNNRTFQVLSGEGLGGGSLINSSVYMRGLRSDWDSWNQLGWSYDELLPYFKKSETSFDHPDPAYRGQEGPWVNQTPRWFNYKPLNFYRDACVALGIPHVKDINGPDVPATALCTSNLTIDKQMKRVSTAAAFLPKSLCLARRSHLKICTNTLARQLDIETTTSGILRARGVYMESSSSAASGANPVFYVRARKEIILSAGALATPQLLLLSGIGPKEHLVSKGINVVHDLPGVGSNLQDHCLVPVSYQVPMRDSMHRLLSTFWGALVEVLKYLVFGTGPLAVGFMQLTLFLQTSALNDKSEISITGSHTAVNKPDENVPDAEIMGCPTRSASKPVDEIDKVGVFTLLTCIVKPKSMGTIRLASKDPWDRALVDLNFFSHTSDILVFRKTIRFAFRIAEEMRRLGYPLKDLRIPASDSDSDIDNHILTYAMLSYHYSSSCRMAPLDDPRPGVVNHELKVHDIEGLRICDTSIFPQMLGTHTMAPVVVVAEKCADMIKATLFGDRRK
ncbi:alcohol oxidase [Panus rudis PR-1116 ss-1]|nr:alcohol oxidase [Panus rudis PR-1116 ss-1]